MSQDSSVEHKESVAAYDGNPFTTAWRGIQKLFSVNGQLLVGLAFFNAMIIIILIATAGTVAYAITAYAVNHSPGFMASIIDQAGSQSPNASAGLSALYDSAQGMKDVNIFVTVTLGLLLMAGLGAFLKALQITIALASSNNKTLRFNDALKRALKRTLPIVELHLILLGGGIAAILALGLVMISSQFIGHMAVILSLLGWLLLVYVVIRLIFAKFILVDSTLSAIAALKRSWSITSGHFVEILGIGAVVMAAGQIAMLLLRGLMMASLGSRLSAAVAVLWFAVFIIAIILVTVAVTERYVQIAHHKATADPTPTNYLAIVLVLLMIPIMHAAAPDTNSEWPAKGGRMQTQMRNSTNGDPALWDSNKADFGNSTSEQMIAPSLN
jgi:hypothetical protein